jgi:hypothetical protein
MLDCYAGLKRLMSMIFHCKELSFRGYMAASMLSYALVLDI